MHISELDTPAVIIDLDIMERNLARVGAYARQHGLRLRPHTKTHKIPALGRKQIESGACGLTIAKVSEAEVMMAAQAPEMLIAYPVIGHNKLERLGKLARQAKFTVALDSLAAARQLSDAARAGDFKVGVLAEVDMGLHRVGVEPEEALALVKSIARLPHLTFEGMAFYPGHIHVIDEGALRVLEGVEARLHELLRELRGAGFECRVVSGGSTPTLFESHRVPSMNEIRPGTYIFNDGNTVGCGTCTWDDCAASLLMTVVSTAVKGQMILDGGSKTFSSDRHLTGASAGFGRIVEAPSAVIGGLNEEHAYVDIRRAEREFQVGDRVRVVPNHICTVMNLHERVHGIRGDQVEQVWAVEGRGKLQ